MKGGTRQLSVEVRPCSRGCAAVHSGSSMCAKRLPKSTVPSCVPTHGKCAVCALQPAAKPFSAGEMVPLMPPCAWLRQHIIVPFALRAQGSSTKGMKGTCSCFTSFAAAISMAMVMPPLRCAKAMSSSSLVSTIISAQMLSGGPKRAEKGLSSSMNRMQLGASQSGSPQ